MHWNVRILCERYDHFEVVHNNISDDKLATRLKEYMKYGTPFANNKVVFTSKSLLERYDCFLKYKIKSNLDQAF